MALLYCMIVVVFAFVVIALLTRDRAAPCQCDECVAERQQGLAEQLEREEHRMRAQARHTIAQTELTASLIDKARIDAEYAEIGQITEYDRKVRNLKRSA
jgi:hypothetical protein